MANSLGEELTGKHVIIGTEYLQPQYHPIEQRVFLVEGGFGAVPFTSGTALIGRTIIDGEQMRLEGFMVERLATEEEVALATSSRENG